MTKLLISESILDDCAELALLEAKWKRLSPEWERNRAEHEERMAQARADVAACLPVRWCEHCQHDAKPCWFHRNYGSGQ